jgi:hypothetical protein
MATFSAIRTLVEAAIGRTDKTTTVNSAINIAQSKVASEHLWNDLLTEASVTLVADQGTIGLASDMRRLSEVRLIDGLNSYRIIVLPKTKFSRFYPNPTALSSSKPRFAYLQGTTLHFAPPPDSTYTVTYSYYVIPADMTDDAHTTSIPQADEAVISYAVYWMFKSMEKHDDAVQWLGDYEDQLKDARRVDRSSATQEMAIRRRAGGPINEDYWIDPFIGHYPAGYGQPYSGYGYW